MKKQLLILSSFILLAGFSFGQATTGSAPRGTTCVDGPLNPIAGKPYIYQAAATPTGGNFTFWATKNQNFISTSGSPAVTTTNIATMLLSPTTVPVGADLIATSANYGLPNTSDQVSITWTDAVLSATTAASPTFVATKYDAPASGCADNFRVWSITPIKAFTVDIRNIENTAGTILAYEATDNQCVDIVRGALYNAGTVEYNFGTQYLYYEVIAANFSGSWVPTFTLTGLSTAQTAVIEYTLTPPPFTATTTWVSTTPAPTITTTVTNTSLGVSIYVRVTITNNTSEVLAALPITLAADGVNAVGEWDIENNTPSNPGPLCNPGSLNDHMDIAIQTLDPRPTLTPVAPNTFVPTNVTP